MKVLSTVGLTKLIQLIKSAFISVDDTVTATTVELANVATTGDYEDLINTPKYGADLSYTNSQLQLLDQDGNNLGNPVTISGGGTWGSITGTLSNQTDLQNALNNKLNLSGGTMTGDIYFNGSTIHSSISNTGLNISSDLMDSNINSSGIETNFYGDPDENLNDVNFTVGRNRVQYYCVDANSGNDVCLYYFEPNEMKFYLTDSNDNSASIMWSNTDINTLKIPTPTQNYANVSNDAAITAGWLKTNAMPLKQDTLVSGTNIKTINNESILGSGNITISGGGGTWGSITGTLSDQTDLQDALDDKVEYAMVIVDYTGE